MKPNLFLNVLHIATQCIVGLAVFVVGLFHLYSWVLHEFTGVFK